MRRLWAYIVTAFTSLVLVATSFANVFLGANSNLEYTKGREMVFFTSEKDETTPVHKEGEESMASVTAKEMEDRLANYNLSSYEVTTMGDDGVKVTTYQDDDTDYTLLAHYLSFNGSLAITTSKTDGTAVAWTKAGSNFIAGSAYRTEISDINPAIVIPVNQDDADFKEVLAEAAEAYEESETTDDDGNTTQSAYLYFWHDYEAGDSYSSLSEQSDVLNSKLVMTITFKPDNSDGTGNSDLYLDGNKSLMYAMINQDFDSDENVTSEELQQAYWYADYYVRLINASELTYKVDYEYYNDATARVESLVDIGTTDYLANSKTLTATLVAIAVLALLLIVFFRLGSVSTIVTNIVTAFSAVGFIVLFSLEFNTAGIVGVIMAVIASMVSGVIYLTKLKDEAYKGRTLKKANTEAGKKSVLPIVDVNLVVIIIGAMTFLLGGTLMRTFSVACVLGGLVSLLLNLIVLRLMMWLATNTTKLTGKYELFGIDADKVPDHTAEEKQTYFGAYADKDFTKKKKPVAIIAAVLFVASLVGSITFSCLNGGDLFRTSSTTEPTQVVLKVTDNTESANDAVLAKILSNVHYFTSETATAEERKAAPALIKVSTDGDITSGGSFASPDDSITSWVKDEKENLYKEVTTYVYVVELTNNLKESVYACYIEDSFSIGVTDETFTINELLEEYLASDYCTISGNPTLALKSETMVYSSTPKTGTYPKAKWILLSTLIGCAIIGFYLLLRYRLTRGLASIIMPLVVSMITLGVFVLTRVIASSYIVVAIPLVAAFSFMVGIIFMNKERELVLEDKTHDKSYENREAIMVKANSIAFTPILYSTILALYLVIDFFGFGPSATAMIYIVAILGVLLATLILTTLWGPCAQLFYKWFSKIHFKARPKKNKKAKAKQKTAEPEEAIFIGIND